MSLARYSFERDVDGWLKDELTVYPERIRKELFQKAQAYRRQPERPHDLTIRSFSPMIEGWAIEMMTPAEQLDFRVRRMADRELLEAIYRKVCA